MINCAAQPIKISFGLLKTSAKSLGFIVSPMPNITIIKR
jgi:hypothetical protein